MQLVSKYMPFEQYSIKYQARLKDCTLAYIAGAAAIICLDKRQRLTENTPINPAFEQGVLQIKNK